MFSNNLENAFEFESERRKDEMRDAANSHLAHQASGNQSNHKKAANLLDALLSLLAMFIG